MWRRRRWIYLSAIAASACFRPPSSFSPRRAIPASPKCSWRIRRATIRGRTRRRHPIRRRRSIPRPSKARPRRSPPRTWRARRSKSSILPPTRNSTFPRGPGARAAPTGASSTGSSRALLFFPCPSRGCCEIEFVSRDPALAARAANTVAEVFLQSQTEAKANAARAASAWLARKIEELREQGRRRGREGRDLSRGGRSDRRARTGRRFRLNSSPTSTPSSPMRARLRRRRRPRRSCCATLKKRDVSPTRPISATDELMRRLAEQRVTLMAADRRGVAHAVADASAHEGR